jgi:hypothetical protein
MSYPTRKGKIRAGIDWGIQQTGRKPKRRLRKTDSCSRRRVALGACCLANALTFDAWADWYLENRSKPPTEAEKTHQANLEVRSVLRPDSASSYQDITARDLIEAYPGHKNTIPTRQEQARNLREEQAQARHGPQGVSACCVHLERGGEEAPAGVNPCQGVDFPVRSGRHDAQAALLDCASNSSGSSSARRVPAQHGRDHGRDGAAALPGAVADAEGAGRS